VAERREGTEHHTHRWKILSLCAVGWRRQQSD